MDNICTITNRRIPSIDRPRVVVDFRDISEIRSNRQPLRRLAAKHKVCNDHPVPRNQIRRHDRRDSGRAIHRSVRKSYRTTTLVPKLPPHHDDILQFFQEPEVKLVHRADTQEILSDRCKIPSLKAIRNSKTIVWLCGEKKSMSTQGAQLNRAGKVIAEGE